MSSSESEMEKLNRDACVSQDDSKSGDEKERQTWGGKHEFILALVGYSVGLGNVWRFPYLCYKNGGGAFLIPYILCVVLAGVPMFFLELSLGQYTQQSALGVWKLVPSMKGVGYGSAVINFFCGIYYMLVMSWSLLYLVHSFIPGPLPWTSCDGWWNTDACKSHWAVINNGNSTVANTTAYNITVSNSTSPEMEFWERYVLRKTDGIDNIGTIENWPIVICFLVAWCFIYFCVFKGVKSGGKVVYVSATLPYIMLFVLLVRGLTLEGAGEGILYFLRPDFSKLANAQVWVEAGGQIFYSYGICFTVLMAFGSYNKFHNDCYKQSIILAGTCSLTSVLASFAIFSILGHMSLVQGKNITEVATSGPGLVFLVYPTGLSLLPLPWLWSIVFFITLFMIGIDTQFGGVEGTISVILDTFPRIERTKYGREKASAVVSLALLILGIPLLSNGGIYVFEMFNMYAVSGISLLFVTFFQSIAIGWVYGVERYYDNVKEMIGYYPSPYFKWCFRFFTPAITLFIFGFFCFKYTPLVLDGYVYPVWANTVGWLLSLSSMLCIPAFFLLALWKSHGSIKKRFFSILNPPESPTIRSSLSEKV